MDVLKKLLESDTNGVLTYEDEISLSNTATVSYKLGLKAK